MVYTFKEVIGQFLSDENIASAKKSKNPTHRTVTVPWHELSFRPKNFSGITHKTTLQNSWFNRPFNDKNPYNLVDKARYAIQIISEIADLGVIPVSYIYDFPDGFSTPRLYLKDRGHSTHILSDLTNLKLTVKQWKQVVKRLEERPSEYVMNIIRNIEKNVAKNTTKVFTLDDMLTDDDRERLHNLSVTVKVSIESLANHKDEMAYINNNQNKWTPHTFGMLELVTHIVTDETSKLNVDDVYEYVSKCDVFLGEGQGRLFEGRQDTVSKYVSHEDEILWFWIGCRLNHKKDLRSRYNDFELSENIDLRKKIYSLIVSDRNNTTKKMIEYAHFIQDVGSNTKWTQLITTIKSTADRVEELRGESPAGLSNITDLCPTKPRAALRWIDMVYDIWQEAASDVDYSHVVTRIVDRAIDMLELSKNDDIEDNPVVETLLARKASRIRREEHFYTILQTELLTEFKNESISGRHAKKAKVTKLQSLLTENGIESRELTVVDRNGKNSYTYTTINLVTGDGFQIGHKVSRKHGGRSTGENTFLQFPADNVYNSSDDIEEGYWTQYKKWVETVEKSQKKLPKVEKEYFANTKRFCEILGNSLI